MAERICEKCGASNPATSSFCYACDTYINWTVPTEERVAPGGGPPPGGGAPPGNDDRPQPRVEADPNRKKQPARAPVVGLDETEVTVTPDAPAVITMSVKNPSTIVESYVVQVQDPPDWLVLTHGDTNLLPGELRKVPVTFAIRPQVTAVAQRVRARVLIRSSVDTTLAAEEYVEIVVPRSGPAAVLTARPNLVRLHDSTRGNFEILLDNRAANYPRHYRLAAADQEGVVVVEFQPPAVDVPAGGTIEAMARFVAPAPPPGEEMSRQLTVTATAEDGQVSGTVTVTQATSAEPERVPIRILVEPSRLALVDNTSVMVDVVLDNRAGHHQAEVALSGRDPERAVSFVFDRPTCVVPAGLVVRIRVVVTAALPPRGESVTRSFTIVASERGQEVTADGSLEHSSRPAAITSALLRVVPEHLMVNGKRGTFNVEIDNRLGAEPLHLHLSGADEYGQSRLMFRPVSLMVPPGQFGGATLNVRQAKPAGGKAVSRKIRVLATSGVDSIQGEAVFTQEVPDRRRLWAILLVLFGALLVALGVVVFLDADATLATGLNQAVRDMIDAVKNNAQPSADLIRKLTGAGAIGVVALSAIIMVFGLAGGGRGVRAATVLAALASIAVTVSSGVLDGLPFVLAGAVIGFLGSLMLRPRS